MGKEGKNGTYLEVQLPISEKELEQQQALVLKGKDRRRPEICRLYFSEERTLQEVGAILGISKSQVAREVDEIRDEMFRTIKKDIRANKKALGCMANLLVGVDCQIRTVWRQCNELERDSIILRAGLDKASVLLWQNPEAEVANIQELIEKFRTVLGVHNTQQGYLALLAKLGLAKLEILDRFGLTDEKALDLILTGGTDVEMKLQEARTAILNMLKLIRTEVKDKKEQERIFLKFAEQITATGINELQLPKLEPCIADQETGRPENQTNNESV